MNAAPVGAIVLNSVSKALKECLDEPIDFFKNDGAKSEFDYIRTLEQTYWRTLQDVIDLHVGCFSPGPIAGKVLEISSYLGVTSIAMREAGFEVVAQNIPEYIEHPRIQERYARHGIAWKAVNLRSYRLPYESGSFDGVVMCEVFEHLNFNPVTILVEVNRVLKTGGWLYLATPNAGNIVKRLRIIRGLTAMDPVDNFFGALTASDGGIVGMYWREYMPYELQKLLRRTGFSQLRHYYCHYADRHHRSLLHRKLVKLMYYFVPAFFPAQVVMSPKEKPAAVNIRFTDATKPLE